MTLPSPQSVSPIDEKYQNMSSGAPEPGTNGFTAVNDRSSPQNLAQKAIEQTEARPQHREDWSHANSESNQNYQHFSATNKRRFDEMEAESRASNPSASTPPSVAGQPPSRPEGVPGDVDSRAAQPSRENWNTDEVQMAALLQNESASKADGTPATSPNGKSDSQSHPPAPPSSNGDEPMITNAGLQVDMKKRKRAFANRTKTGCQTCRKRKKKCDEAKPSCNNCVKGGFTCLGYAQKRDLGTKTTSLGRHQQNIAPAGADYWPEMQQQRATPFDANGAPVQAPDGRHTPLVEDGRNMTAWSSSAYNSPAPRQLERPSLPPPAIQPPPAPPAFSRNLSGPSTGGYAPYSAAQAARSALNHTPPEPRMDYPTRPTITASDNVPPPPENRDRFKPSEAMYVKDREQCRIACGRFNQQSYSGAGADEIRRCFRLIVQPDGPNAYVPPGSRDGERVGKDVWVEAPFRADYGYNLNIGDNVTIDSGCVFKDATAIYIGNNTRIGANVTISGEHMCTEDQWRQWSKKVTVRIGQNCTIGAGCVIVAPDRLELVIGDNAYIAPGTVVTQDVPGNHRLFANHEQAYNAHHSIRPS